MPSSGRIDRGSLPKIVGLSRCGRPVPASNARGALPSPALWDNGADLVGEQYGEPQLLGGGCRTWVAEVSTNPPIVCPEPRTEQDLLVRG